MSRERIRSPRPRRSGARFLVAVTGDRRRKRESTTNGLQLPPHSSPFPPLFSLRVVDARFATGRYRSQEGIRLPLGNERCIFSSCWAYRFRDTLRRDTARFCTARHGHDGAQRHTHATQRDRVRKQTGGR